jgi:hypothetical protein
METAMELADADAAGFHPMGPEFWPQAIDRGDLRPDARPSTSTAALLSHPGSCSQRQILDLEPLTQTESARELSPILDERWDTCPN